MIFFRITWKYRFLDEVHCLCFNWIHHIAGFIWAQSKLAIVHFKGKVESEVEWSTKLQFFF